MNQIEEGESILNSIAYAMGAGAGQGGQGGGFSAILPLVLMFAIFYLIHLIPFSIDFKINDLILFILTPVLLSDIPMISAISL